MIVQSPGGIATMASANESTKTETSDKKDLGQTDFLTLLVAQLKHQDPMNPMENAEFTQQMAQFSSLEQLIDINTNLGALATATNATNSAQAMNLIGKEVKAEGENIHISNGIASNISFELPDTALSATINVEDAAGNVVATIEKGTMPAGSNKIEWDGTNSAGAQLPDGLYTFSVYANDVDGNTMDPVTFSKGIVSSVSFENGVGYVHIGDNKYMLSEILEVSQPKTATPSTVSQGTDGENTSGLIDTLV